MADDDAMMQLQTNLILTAGALAPSHLKLRGIFPIASNILEPGLETLPACFCPLYKSFPSAGISGLIPPFA